jgi:uncharacterized damage-inducible protein DinB
MLRNALLACVEQLEVILKTVKHLPDHQSEDVYKDLGVGRHIRHVIDHFLALKLGLPEGVIDYNRRNRDSVIERDLHAAMDLIKTIKQWIMQIEIKDTNVGVVSEVDCFKTVNCSFTSTLSRELLYLINHTIHHAAYIKLLMRTKEVELPDYIGIAPGTASFLRVG